MAGGAGGTGASAVAALAVCGAGAGAVAAGRAGAVGSSPVKDGHNASSANEQADRANAAPKATNPNRLEIMPRVRLFASKESRLNSDYHYKSRK